MKNQPRDPRTNYGIWKNVILGLPNDARILAANRYVLSLFVTLASFYLSIAFQSLYHLSFLFYVPCSEYVYLNG